jgi:glycosyltransferase involved in cell wall biosynthesis
LSAPRQRILFVLEYFYPHVGGVETLFLQLTEALAAAGHSVCVVTLRLPGTPARETHNGVEIVRVRAPRLASRYFFTVLALPAVLRRARAADVIHTTTYNAAIPAWLASALLRRPAAITVHEVFGPQWNDLPGLNRWLGYGFRLFEWSVLRLPFSHYICDSEFTRGRLLRLTGVAPGRSSVVYPAIDYTFWDPARHRARDLRRDLGLGPVSFLYLYFGRPGISKGVEYLIDAVPLVRERLPGSRLVLLMPRDPAGQYERLLARVAALGVGDGVTVLDPVPRAELPGYLLGADCVVVPSVSEGFGYAAAEAVLLGCPVVATSGHAVEEVVGGGARLVPPRSPRALADAIVATAQGRPAAGPPPRQHDIAAHIAGVRAAYAGLLARNGADLSARETINPQRVQA